MKTFSMVVLLLLFLPTIGVLAMGERVEERQFILDNPAYKPHLAKPYNLDTADQSLEKLVEKYGHNYEKVKKVILRDNPDATESIFPTTETFSGEKKENIRSPSLFVRRGKFFVDVYSARFIVDKEGNIVDQKFISNVEGF